MKSGRDEVSVHPADTGSRKPACLDHLEHIVIRQHGCAGQHCQIAQDLASATSKVPERDLPEHEGVEQDLGGVKPRFEGATLGGAAEVVDPNRSVDQDHAGSVRRRGIG